MKLYILMQIKLDYVMLRQHELEKELKSLEAQPSTRSTARRRRVSDGILHCLGGSPH